MKQSISDLSVAVIPCIIFLSFILFLEKWVTSKLACLISTIATISIYLMVIWYVS